jgi:hypothetical protein
MEVFKEGRYLSSQRTPSFIHVINIRVLRRISYIYPSFKYTFKYSYTSVITTLLTLLLYLSVYVLQNSLLQFPLLTKGLFACDFILCWLSHRKPRRWYSHVSGVIFCRTVLLMHFIPNALTFSPLLYILHSTYVCISYFLIIVFYLQFSSFAAVVYTGTEPDYNTVTHIVCSKISKHSFVKMIWKMSFHLSYL